MTSANNDTPHLVRSTAEATLVDGAVTSDDWGDWRKFTRARIAIGRAGAALPTREVLDFGLAHAQACDAIHTALDVDQLQQQCNEHDWPSFVVHSQADNRETYLRRPDLGRKLAAQGHQHWQNYLDSQYCYPTSPCKPYYDIVFVIADGLSSLAVQRHAIPLIEALKRLLNPDYVLAPIVIAQQARVALGDEIAEMMNAKLVVMLIGERPGLSAADSLGIYLTYEPRIGKHDAERNCISNVRPEGLSLPAAAFKLNWMIDRAFKLCITGVNLKDESDYDLPLDFQSATPRLANP